MLCSNAGPIRGPFGSNAGRGAQKPWTRRCSKPRWSSCARCSASLGAASARIRSWQCSRPRLLPPMWTSGGRRLCACSSCSPRPPRARRRSCRSPPAPLSRPLCLKLRLRMHPGARRARWRSLRLRCAARASSADTFHLPHRRRRSRTAAVVSILHLSRAHQKRQSRARHRLRPRSPTARARPPARRPLLPSHLLRSAAQHHARGSCAYD